MPTNRIDKEVRERALELVSEGMSRVAVRELYGIKRQTLEFWLRKERDGQEFSDHPAWRCKVGDVRKACALLDEGFSVQEVSHQTGHTAQTIRRWKNDPKFREATFEYDAAMRYDETDLLDRATVAQYLCIEASPSERLNLLFAVVGDQEIIDAPEKRGYGRSLHGSA